MKTIEAANGKWLGILKHFGVDEQFLRNQHGPCPSCGGKDRYRWDDKDGTGSYYCGGCGAGRGMDLLMLWTGMDFKTAAAAVDDVIGNIEREDVKPKRDPVDRLRKIATGLADMASINPVRLYLNSRDFSPTRTTQYHPGLAYYEDGKYVGKYPAMIHVFESATGSPLTYHVTYLTTKGEKAPVQSAKKVMPPVGPLAGGAIRLHPCSDVLGIAEGIETALGALKRTGVPTWAAYSATLLEQFQPPETVKKIVIFGDNDESFTGQKSAFVLAHRLKREGFDVEVRIPDCVGTDWADEVSA